MLRRSHLFLGITSTFGGVNVSCSRKQHTDPAEDRTRDPDPESDALTIRPVRPPLTIMNNLITLHVYKERTDALGLRGQNRCSIFSDVGF